MHLDVRREQVLDAALRLVAHDGYAAATMEAVAREAQLAKPRVYAAYPGRGPLLMALLEREEKRWVNALAEAMPAFTDEADFDDTSVAAATNLLSAVAANPDGSRLLLLPTHDAPEEVRGHIEVGREFALNNLRALLSWGRERRPGLAELDLELTAQSLLAMGEHAARLVLVNPDEFSPERYGKFARGLLAILGPATVAPSE